MIRKIEEFTERAKSGPRKRVVLVNADDLHALQAVAEARDVLAGSLLLGRDTEAIRAALREIGEPESAHHIVAVPEGIHPAAFAAKLIHQGEGDFLMKGNITTADMLRGVLADGSDMRTGRLMSGIVALELPDYHKLIYITDGGLNMYPDLAQKKQIAENAAAFLRRLGYRTPAIAALCAIEKVNPKMPETLDAAELQRMSRTGEIAGCTIEGPISYDCAMVPENARIKGFSSEKSGDFDVLLVPDIVSGNILTKALVYQAKAHNCGVVVGARVPIVLPSRGCTAREKHDAIALAAIL